MRMRLYIRPLYCELSVTDQEKLSKTSFQDDVSDLRILDKFDEGKLKLSLFIAVHFLAT